MGTTAVTAIQSTKKLGPVSLSGTEETVVVTLTNTLTVLMMVGDAAWLYDDTAGQTNSVPVAAGQPLTLRSCSALSFTFYARTATGTAKLYIVPLE